LRFKFVVIHKTCSKRSFLCISGAKAIQCLDGVNLSENLGYIETLEHEILNKRSYLHLTRGAKCVSTLMLCHRQEQQLDELKVSVLFEMCVYA